VITPWSHRHPHLVHSALCELADLCLEEQNRAIAVRLGGVPTILNAMVMYPKPPRLLAQGCRALQNTACGNDLKNCGTTALGVIMQAMMFNKNDRQVQTQGLGALATFVCCKDDADYFVSSVCGVPLIVESMKLAHDDAELQKYASRILHRLVKFGSSGCKKAIVEAKGAEALSDAMKNHKNPGVEHAGPLVGAAAPTPSNNSKNHDASTLNKTSGRVAPLRQSTTSSSTTKSAQHTTARMREAAASTSRPPLQNKYPALESNGPSQTTKSQKGGTLEKKSSALQPFKSKCDSFAGNPQSTKDGTLEIESNAAESNNDPVDSAPFRKRDGNTDKDIPQHQSQSHPKADFETNEKENEVNGVASSGHFPDVQHQPPQQQQQQPDVFEPETIDFTDFYAKNPHLKDIFVGLPSKIRLAFKVLTDILGAQPMQAQDLDDPDGMIKIELQALTFGLFNLYGLWYSCILTPGMGKKFSDLYQSLDPDKKNQPIFMWDGENRIPPTKKDFPSALFYLLCGPLSREKAKEVELRVIEVLTEVCGWGSANIEMYLKAEGKFECDDTRFAGIASHVDFAEAMLSGLFDFNGESHAQVPHSYDEERKYELKKRVDVFGELPIDPNTTDREERTEQFLYKYIFPAVNHLIEGIHQRLKQLEDPRAELITRNNLSFLFSEMYCRMFEIPKAPKIDKDLLSKNHTSCLPLTPLQDEALIDKLYGEAQELTKPMPRKRKKKRRKRKIPNVSEAW